MLDAHIANAVATPTCDTIIITRIAFFMDANAIEQFPIKYPSIALATFRSKSTGSSISLRKLVFPGKGKLD
eukprot:786857-Rhodomonas_salina.2